MANFKVTLSDGRKFKVQVEGDQPPSEQDILAHLGQPAPQPAPAPGIRGSISRAARPVLEFGGAIAGGIAASPAAATGIGALAIPVGGALGFAAGNQTANLLDQALGLRRGPRTMGQAVSETEKSIRHGAMAEAGGPILGALPKMLPGSAASKAAAATAKRYGVDLTGAEATGSKTTALVESALEKLPFSGSMVQKFRQRQAGQLEGAAQNLIKKLGTVEAPETVGKQAQSAIETQYFKRLKTRDKLFDKLTAKVPKDIVIQTPNMQKSAATMLEKEQQLPGSFQSDAVNKILADVEKIRQAGLSFHGAKTLRERLGGMIGPVADTPEKQFLKELKRSLDKDIGEFAVQSGGEIKTAWTRANKFHGAVKNLNKDPNIQKVVNANPERVVDAVFRPGAVSEVKLLKKATGPKEFKKIQSGIVNRLFTGAANQNPSQALVTNLNKYGEDTLGAALPAKTINRLKEFASVAARAKGAEKIAGNPSGTAQTEHMMKILTWQAGTAGSMGAYAWHNPATGILSFITPPALAKMYLSDAGRKAIIQGMTIPATHARAGSIAATIATLQRKAEDNDALSEALGVRRKAGR